MSDGNEADKVTVTPAEVGKVSEIIPPGQAIESSRKLDIHLQNSVKDFRRRERGALSTKISDLATEMDDFNTETHLVVDGVRDKIRLARRKRDEAVEVQHAHYDGLIGDFQETIDASEQFSNLPLDRGGKS